jgi:hypothetical protein
MDISEMVLLCLETFRAGYDADKRLVEINWLPWDKEPTPKIRCLFWPGSSSRILCCVHPAVSGTHGVDLDTGRIWELPN